MKKVFLLFGVAAFSSVAAQEKDLFDVQKHLQDKQNKGKQQVEKKAPALPLSKPFTFLNPVYGLESSQPFSNGNTIIILGIDNMPCIKPDMNLFKTMPNVADNSPFNFNYSPNRIQPGQMPNGSNPFRFIVAR